MAAPLNVWMPDNVDLGAGYTLRVTALSPTTGALVAGVNVTTTVIEGAGTGDLSSGDFLAGPFMLVPGPNA